ncbi:MAG TPA: endonuclease/exonuclease/phosphatase family protein, partial [Feifaniaceae bacterium]|nr:endonuclease/exonuclease/phosphatase family protein [Feifaniaceae bacterium]
MKLISWNVNGLRACITKGFFDFVKDADPDILALQETKMQPEQFEGDAGEYKIYWN